MEIELTIGKTLDGQSEFTGFRYIWLRYVHGFNPNKHCQESFQGKNDSRFHKKMEIGQSFVLREPTDYKYIYFCGEASIPNAGLHLALEPQEGATAELITYNGIQISVKNARQLPIPPISDGFEGMSHAYTSCVNWQFGVKYFGTDNLRRDKIIEK